MRRIEIAELLCLSARVHCLYPASRFVVVRVTVTDLRDLVESRLILADRFPYRKIHD